MRIVFLLSRRNEGNKGNLLPPSAKHFLLFLPFLRDFYYTMRLAFPRKSIFVPRKERKEQKSLLRTARSLSAISVISVGHYYLMRIVFLLSRSHRLCRFARRSHRLCRFACRRNEGNIGNSSFGCCLRPTCCSLVRF